MRSVQDTRGAANGACVTICTRVTLAVFLLLGVTRSGLADDAMVAAEQYLSAWQAGDATRMYQLLRDDAKKEVGAEEFQEAFTVRLPFTDDTYVVRPIRFDHVRLRPDSTGIVDYRAVFTVESLLGPLASRIFCADKRTSLTLPDLRRARVQALCLLYDQARPDSPYVNIAYVVGLWWMLTINDMLSLVPSDAAAQRDAGALPRVGLEAEWELVVDTGTTTIGPWQVCARSRPFRLAALEVSQDGRIGLPLGTRQAASPGAAQLDEKDFSRLISLMGLDWP